MERLELQVGAALSRAGLRSNHINFDMRAELEALLRAINAGAAAAVGAEPQDGAAIQRKAA